MNCGFSGQAGPELRPQSCSGRTDEMHQESNGEFNHWTSSQGDQRHVSGFGSQVGTTELWIRGVLLLGLLPVITFCCLKYPCGFFSAFVTTTEAVDLRCVFMAENPIVLRQSADEGFIVIFFQLIPLQAQVQPRQSGYNDCAGHL